MQTGLNRLGSTEVVTKPNCNTWLPNKKENAFGGLHYYSILDGKFPAVMQRIMSFVAPKQRKRRDFNGLAVFNNGLIDSKWHCMRLHCRCVIVTPCVASLNPPVWTPVSLWLAVIHQMSQIWLQTEEILTEAMVCFTLTLLKTWHLTTFGSTFFFCRVCQDFQPLIPKRIRGEVMSNCTFVTLKTYSESKDQQVPVKCRTLKKWKKGQIKYQE